MKIGECRAWLTTAVILFGSNWSASVSATDLDEHLRALSATPESAHAAWRNLSQEDKARFGQYARCYFDGFHLFENIDNTAFLRMIRWLLVPVFLDGSRVFTADIQWYEGYAAGVFDTDRSETRKHWDSVCQPLYMGQYEQYPKSPAYRFRYESPD